MKKRVNGAIYTCIIILSLLCVRLVQIGIIDGKTYETMAQSQQNKKQLISNNRGIICDRNGESLTDSDELTLYLDLCGNISKKSRNFVYKISTKKRFSPIASHIIGYTDSDGLGLCGIEKTYNDFLASTSGVYLSYMADAAGNPVKDYMVYNEGRAETKVKLTIDSEIQNICENVMDRHIEKGAVVVLDVKSFDVLASVSRPAFDPDKIPSYRNSENGELLNRAFMPFNAGSVFKIVTTAASVENSRKNLLRKFNCKGVYYPDKKHKFYCHKTNGHGILSFDSAFAKSCNCAFYSLALDNGATDIIDMAFDFGFGQKLLNASIGESCGILPVRNKYSPAETLNIAIGQGEIMVTPLQCASMVATVANGGVRRDINLVDEFVYSYGSTDARNKGATRVISKDTASVISQMMKKCVTDGTGMGAFSDKVSIAGKTGSAETGILAGGEPQVHGWFCGFFPADSPKYAMVVFSEGGKSGSLCTEPFVKIAEEICRTAS